MMIDSSRPGDHDALVLQGGGGRCFFTLGFLEEAATRLQGVRQVAAVSASCAMAVAHLLGEHRSAMERFALLVSKNPRNFYPLRLLVGRRPMPHHDIYHGVLMDTICPKRFERLRTGPVRLRLLLGTGPGRSRALAVGLAVLAVVRGQTRFLGSQVIDVGTLSRREDLVDAILASSAFPPFTRVPMDPQRGVAIIDGGAVEPVPLSALCQERPVRSPLIILTRPSPPRPLPPAWLRLATVIAPLRPLSISTWDYADQGAVRRVYDEGRRAGERFLRAGG